MYYVPGLYMIGYGKGKIILKFPPFFRLNEENQELENLKHEMKTKTFCFCFHLILNFLLLKFLVHNSKHGNFKIIFLVLYPIIYNSGSGDMGFFERKNLAIKHDYRTPRLLILRNFSTPHFYHSTFTPK